MPQRDRVDREGGALVIALADRLATQPTETPNRCLWATQPLYAASDFSLRSAFCGPEAATTQPAFRQPFGWLSFFQTALASLADADSHGWDRP